MKNIFLILFLSFLISSLCYSQAESKPDTLEYIIKIIDEKGRPLENVSVRLNEYPYESVENGEALIEGKGIVEGTYNIYIYKEGYNPIDEKITLSSHGEKYEQYILIQIDSFLITGQVKSNGTPLSNVKVTLNMGSLTDHTMTKNSGRFIFKISEIDYKREYVNRNKLFSLDFSKSKYKYLSLNKQTFDASSNSKILEVINLEKETIKPEPPQPSPPEEANSKSNLIWIPSAMIVLGTISTGFGYFDVGRKGNSIYQDYKVLTNPKDFIEKYPEYANRKEGFEDAKNKRDKGLIMIFGGFAITSVGTVFLEKWLDLDDEKVSLTVEETTLKVTYNF